MIGSSVFVNPLQEPQNMFPEANSSPLKSNGWIIYETFFADGLFSGKF